MNIGTAHSVMYLLDSQDMSPQMSEDFTLWHNFQSSSEALPATNPVDTREVGCNTQIVEKIKT
jgi:hypothetical protein